MSGAADHRRRSTLSDLTAPTLPGAGAGVTFGGGGGDGVVGGGGWGGGVGGGGGGGGGGVEAGGA
ncbi:MAG: hypothetical protein IPL72_00175 [Sulfuritalea sp.]|nr:hypothetical protein [Sulfuritalea sp.]